MKRIVILGSTGSIGRSTLDVVGKYPRRFKVIGLSARSNYRLLARQAGEFGVRDLGIFEERFSGRLKELCPSCRVHAGKDSYEVLTGLEKTDMVVSAIVGAGGLLPTWTAVKNRKHVALANKESLVCAGRLIMELARKNRVRIIPVDSEHSAVYNLLKRTGRENTEEIILTASGGPFLDRKPGDFRKITVRQALAHPTWDMGAKITIDSATMLNKGFEVIEAHHLFGMPYDRIRIIIHPESTVHSLVKANDGSLYAQLGRPDMRIPILSALSEDEPLDARFSKFDLASAGSLTFRKPDHRKFPLIRTAYGAGRAGGILPAVLTAADDIAVRKFLNREIPFTGIHRFIAKTLDRYARKNIRKPGISDIVSVMGKVGDNTVPGEN